jgi:hypothetical protein
MPPTVASCLTVIFVIWLFRCNRERAVKMSRALWIPVIWVAIMGSMPVACWINGRETDLNLKSSAEGSPLDRNICILMIIAGYMVLKKRQINWSEVFQRNRVLWAFYAFAVVSVIWGEEPFVSFKRWIREIGNLIMILVILTEEDPVEAVRQVFARTAYLLIPLSVLWMKYYLPLGRYYNGWTGEACFCGVSSDKNALGRLAMLSALFMLWGLVMQERGVGWKKWVKKAMPDLLVLMMSIWIIRTANSATSLMCFIAGTAVLFGARMKSLRNNPPRLIRYAWALIIVSFLFFYFPNLRSVITGSVGRNVNLTERTDVWEGAFALHTNPLIGEGFAGVWLTPGGLALVERLHISEAHNGFLETYLNGGLIAVGLLGVVLLGAGKSVIRQVIEGSPIASLYAAVFFTGFIYNYTEAAFNNNSIVGFVLWMVAMQYGQPKPVTAPGQVAATTGSELGRASLAQGQVGQ